MEIDIKQLRELLRMMRQSDVTEIELQSGEEMIRVSRGASGSPTVMAAPSMLPGMAMPSVAPPPAPSPSASATAQTEEQPDVAYVTSPFVGTFYRSPSPEAEAFVNINQEVRAGQVLCIVEAMKLMNEIESEHRCVILEVLVENGKPVEYGDRLFKVRKLS